MATTISGKLKDNARTFQAGESMGFGMRLGIKFYNRKTKQNEYTNYEFAVFSKNPNQIAFYHQALVAGSIVTVSAESEMVDMFEGQNGPILKIVLNNARLDYVGTTEGGQPQQPAQNYQQPQGHQQPSNQGFANAVSGQQPQQPPQFGQNTGQPAPRPPGGFDDFSDDIPF